ncbi:superoxide dismutase [Ni] [Ferrimonas gelatinilytica]|uniref:Superoxide dismutase [Ni] n=1 Tax=Ferrimonas gelatinilytica TaxID=1255257 RepID=A0ABP9S8E1_9GAMM
MTIVRRRWLMPMMAVLLSVLTAPVALAHCQVPCGIFDDGARVKALMEDATTIEKAITEMNALASKRDVQSQNQFNRWVMNKESHASHIITVMAEYFLAQRVKPGEDYDKKLREHHAVILAAMKAKQSSDMAAVKALNDAIGKLTAYYHMHE